MNTCLRKRACLYYSLVAVFFLISGQVLGQCLKQEGWQSSRCGSYTPPSDDNPVFITGDLGNWLLGDTASECGPSGNRAEIVCVGGEKSLRLTTVPNNEGCAENMWIARFGGPALALAPDTLLSITMTGSLVNPRWNGFFPTCCPPPGDHVALHITDNRGNQLIYLFQRASNYVPHTRTFPTEQGGSIGYHEVFVGEPDSAGGTYLLNLYSDFLQVPGFVPANASISDLEFGISSVGTATMDNLQIGCVPVTCPTIASQPTDVTVNSGETAKLGVTADGTAPLSYQWRKNGIALPGEVSRSLTLLNTIAETTGNYSVVVLNACGSVTSRVAVVTVIAPIVAPNVIVQPQNQSVNAGESAGFSISAAGSAPLGYQWQRKTAAGNIWSNLTSGRPYLGTSTTNLTILNTSSSMSGDQFRCVVTNSAGAATSSPASLTIIAPEPPKITAEPRDVTARIGMTVSFTVAATGTAPLYFQWQKDGVNLPGANGTTHTISNVHASLTGLYRVIVSNNVASVTSREARVTIASVPVILSQPNDITVPSGENAVFAVAAEGTPPLLYEWRKNGAPIVGAAEASHTITSVQSTNAGIYTVSVRNVAGSTLSRGAELRVGAIYNVTTWAGSTRTGTIDGSLAEARFEGPHGIALDRKGNVYIADDSSHCIRQISPQGVVSTIAGLAGNRGYANGIGTAARFNVPRGIVTDSDDNLFVADWNNAIRKITPDRAVTLFANIGGEALAIDSSDNIYVNNGTVISKVTLDGTVTPLAGAAGIRDSVDGVGSAARFRQLGGMALDQSGNLYAVDEAGATIRKITPTGVVTTLAAVDTTGSPAKLTFPTDIDIDTQGTLYIADLTAILKVTLPGVVTTFAGTPGRSGEEDGPAGSARFWGATGVARDRSGNFYVTDWQNGNIRKIGSEGIVSTLTGAIGSKGFRDGPRAEARFSQPSALAVSASGELLVLDSGNNTARFVSFESVRTLVNTSQQPVQFGNGTTVAVQSPIEFVAAQSHRIVKVSSDGRVSVLAGSFEPGQNDGAALDARFNYPSGLAISSQGRIFVADRNNHTIRVITPQGLVSTFAGVAGIRGSADGPATVARFNSPAAVVIDSSNNLFVADHENHTIRKINPDGIVSTFAGRVNTVFPRGVDGAGTSATFNNPAAIAIDTAGNLFIADKNNSLLRKITPEGIVSTVAGKVVEPGTIDGIGAVARVRFPNSIAVDHFGNIFFTESGNNIVRKASLFRDTIPPLLFDAPKLFDDKVQLKFHRTDGTVPADGTPIEVESRPSFAKNSLGWQSQGGFLLTNGSTIIPNVSGASGGAGFYRALER